MASKTPRSITVIPRSEFLTDRWTYQAGEHVTVIAPTGFGKTRLIRELLQQTISPKLPVAALVMKPRDTEARALGRLLRLQTTYDWPPVLPKLGSNGWLVWPRHRYDPNIDDPHLHRVFRRAILARYKKGRGIIFADEVVGLSKDLALEPELNAVWMRGRSMGCGLWGAAQRPAYVPLHGYSQAQHIFLAHDPDRRSRDRFAEIGGIDPDLIAYVVLTMPKFYFLYIRRDGRRCIVGP
jgi:hypothetical protein